MDVSPTLVLSFSEATSAGDRDRLVALLADFDLVSIHEDDPVHPMQWTAHFESRSARDAAFAAIRAVGRFDHLSIRSSEVEDEDWARRTQADLPAVKVGRIIVAPPWDIPLERGNDVVIVIEPSRGFGTGHHQSTRLALVLLQARDLTQRTMIDVGTGSGVLAIAAAKLGAGYVSAVDVDPDAIENARENIALNQVSRLVEAHVGDLATTTMAPAEVVTANLTGSLLQRNAGELARLVRPGGVLIAAGFTVDERDWVTRAFAPVMSEIESAEEDGWWALVFANPR